jgi:hypothetical protein
LLVALLLALVYFLHQDLWFWRDARPLVFGFLPIGLFYHAAYTAGASALMGLLVKYRWPAHLDVDPRGSRPDPRDPRGPRPDLCNPRGPRPDPRDPRGPRPDSCNPRGPRP